MFNFKGWSSHVHGEIPRSFESTNLSRDNLSREIGTTGLITKSWIITPTPSYIMLHNVSKNGVPSRFHYAL